MMGNGFVSGEMEIGGKGGVGGRAGAEGIAGAAPGGGGGLGIKKDPCWMYSATPGTLGSGFLGHVGGKTVPSEQTAPPSWVA